MKAIKKIEREKKTKERELSSYRKSQIVRLKHKY